MCIMQSDLLSFKDEVVYGVEVDVEASRCGAEEAGPLPAESEIIRTRLNSTE